MGFRAPASAVDQRPAFLALLDDVPSVAAAARELGINHNTAYGWARQAGCCSTRVAGPRPDRAMYAALREQGVSRAVAADRVGIHARTARDWDHGVRKSRNSRFYPDGRRVNYTTGQTTMESIASPPPDLARVEQVVDPQFLSLAEREQIADLRREGQSFRAIGRELGRSASTITREVGRNATATGTYQLHTAHRLAAARRPRPKASKLAAPGRLRTYVAERLQDQWSPEQISRTLRHQFPDDEEMRVSTETIYQAIYVQSRVALEVGTLGEPGGVDGGWRKPHRAPEWLPPPAFAYPMAMTSQRPADVADRAVPGHWKGDLIMDGRNQSAILTLGRAQHPLRVLPGHLPGGPHRQGGPGCAGHPDWDAARAPAAIADLGSGGGDGRAPRLQHRHHRAGSISATPPVRGSADRTRTPMGSCASTSPRGPICPSTAQTSSSACPASSTRVHAKRWTGRHQPSACSTVSLHPNLPRCCDDCENAPIVPGPCPLSVDCPDLAAGAPRVGDPGGHRQDRLQFRQTPGRCLHLHTNPKAHVPPPWPPIEAKQPPRVARVRLADPGCGRAIGDQ